MPDLFIKAQAGESLESFAYRTAKLLSLHVLERRESSNYIGGEYFLSMALSIEMTFSLSDESVLDGYEFWMS